MNKLKARSPQLEDKEVVRSEKNMKENAKQKLIRVVLRYNENHGRVRCLDD